MCKPKNLGLLALIKRSGRLSLKACDAQNLGHNRPPVVGFPIRYRHRPLHPLGGMGLWLATPGLLMLAWLAGLKLLGHDVGGRPLLITGVMLLLMGLQLIVAGLVGEMLIRIYHEGRGQPQFYAHEHDPLADTAPAAGPPDAPLA